MSKVYTYEELKEMSTSELNRLKEKMSNDLVVAENRNNKAILCHNILRLQKQTIAFQESAIAVEEKAKQ
jgi:hypothetical protein